MSDVDVEDQDVAASDGAKGTRRVVLRAVTVSFDDLPEDLRDDVRAAADGVAPTSVKTWLPVAVRNGKPDEAVDAYAGQSGSPGCKPGEFRALPAGTWLSAPRVIEPELR